MRGKQNRFFDSAAQLSKSRPHEEPARGFGRPHDLILEQRQNVFRLDVRAGAQFGRDITADSLRCTDALWPEQVLFRVVGGRFQLII